MSEAMAGGHRLDMAVSELRAAAEASGVSYAAAAIRLLKSCPQEILDQEPQLVPGDEHDAAADATDEIRRELRVITAHLQQEMRRLTNTGVVVAMVTATLSQEAVSMQIDMSGAPLHQARVCGLMAPQTARAILSSDMSPSATLVLVRAIAHSMEQTTPGVAEALHQSLLDVAANAKADDETRRMARAVSEIITACKNASGDKP